MARFNRKPVEVKEETLDVNDIDLASLEQDFQLDEDADLVAKYDEMYQEDDLKDVDIEITDDVKAEIPEEIEENMTIKSEKKKEEKPKKQKAKKEEKVVGNTVTLKEQLMLLNELNNKTKKTVEEALLKSAMCENATSVSLMIPQTSFVYVEKWLKEQDLKVTMGHPQDDKTIGIRVDWS